MRHSRRGVFALAGAGAAVFAGCVDDERDAQNVPPRSDLGVINFALTLEYLEEDFYRRVVESGVLSGGEQSLAREILSNESDHVRSLQEAARSAGGQPVDRPRVDFSGVIGQGRDKVLRTAASLENTGASAYLGQAPEITDPKVLAAALSIHTVEARHAAALDEIVGRPFLPDGSFAEPLGRVEVMAKIERFLV